MDVHKRFRLDPPKGKIDRIIGHYDKDTGDFSVPLDTRHKKDESINRSFPFPQPTPNQIKKVAKELWKEKGPNDSSDKKSAEKLLKQLSDLKGYPDNVWISTDSNRNPDNVWISLTT